MCSFPFCTIPTSSASLYGKRSTERGRDLWGQMSSLHISASVSSENGKGWVSSSHIHSSDLAVLLPSASVTLLSWSLPGSLLLL